MQPNFPFHFVLHDHQPYGNFPEVFAAGWERAYSPSLALLDRYPEFRFGLHITGALWEWIERHHPQAMETIAGMVRRGQVELIGGPFYEPVLALITTRDAAGQIEMMRRFLERRFGVSPRGAWLAERVWQPDLPEVLEDAGIAFTFVDDTHLFTAGPDGERIGGHVWAESRGKRVALFPIDLKLRYTIPFRTPEHTVERLMALRAAGCSSATYADDGEKLGLWPGTHQWVWEEGWMESFVRALLDASEIHTALPSETLESQPAEELVYPPTTSYEELGEWALPPGRQAQRKALIEQLEQIEDMEWSRPLIRGGHFPVFLARYPEANLMHKWMLEVSRRLERAEESTGHRLEAARRALYQAQVNCPYWHGLFGGLYMPVLRHVVYARLAVVERELARAQCPPPPGICRGDLDCDGYEEVWGGRGPGRFLFSSRWAGGLRIWGRWDAEQAVTDVMARRKEAYHLEAPQPVEGEDEPDSPRSIHEIHAAIPEAFIERGGWDRAPRVSGVELLLPAGLTPRRLLAGGSWRDAQLIPARAEASSDDGLSWEVGPPDRIRARRRVSASTDGCRLQFEHLLDDGDAGMVEWGVEWNLALPGRGSLTAAGSVTTFDGSWIAPFKIEATGELTVRSEAPASEVHLECEPPCRVLAHLVETVVRSESGFEGVIQGLCLLFTPPRGQRRVRITASLAPPRC